MVSSLSHATDFPLLALRDFSTNVTQAWTDYAHISIWSPICAAGLFGFGVITLFISTYMYIIDSFVSPLPTTTASIPTHIHVATL